MWNYSLATSPGIILEAESPIVRSFPFSSGKEVSVASGTLRQQIGGNTTPLEQEGYP